MGILTSPDEIGGGHTLRESLHQPPRGISSCAKSREKPIGLSFRSSKTFIAVVVCVAVLTDAFLYTMIIPILPSTLIQRAGVPRDEVQKWISLLLGIYGAANLAIVGHFSDRFASRRTPLLFGLCALMASTTMYCFGTTPAVLVVARALQGASAAVVQVVGLALISDTMGASSAGEAMGWQAIGIFTGTVLGPSLSGIVFDLAGHFAVFGMAYAMLIFDILLRFIMIERNVAERWSTHPDGLGYGTMGVSPDIFGEVVANSLDGQESAMKGAARTGSDVSVADSESLGTLSLLTNSRLLMALWATFICSVLMTSLEGVLPLYAMELFAWTPAESGLLFILLACSIVIDPYIGRLTDRKGPRNLTILGLSMGTAIYLAFCAVTRDTAGNKFLLVLLLFVLGFSLGVIQTPNMVEISLAVDDMRKKTPGGFDLAQVMGRAYSLHAMAYGIGSVLGPLWGGILIQSHGWSVLCLSFVALNAVSAILATFFSGGPVESQELESRE